MIEKRRALVVSYNFAPVAGVATERCRKFVKYLPEFGWETSVLTQSLAKAQLTKPLEIDESCFEELPKDLEIVRVDAPVLGLKKSSADAGEKASASTAPPRRNGPLSWLRALVAGLVTSPDVFLLWIPPALVRGIRLVRQRNCQVIFATGPVFSDLLLGALLSFATRRPLILDYRDPWGENEVIFASRPFKQRYNRFLERLCLRQSARAVFATEGFRDLYAARHPDLAERFAVVPNGYDRDPTTVPDPPERGAGPLRIGYAGKMLGDQYPVEPLFRAVRALVARRGRGCVRLEMAGMIEPAQEALLDELDLRGVVELRSYLTREAVEDLQARSAALLLIIGDVHPFLFGLESAKLFEYMPLRRPILGLVPEGGAAWKILQQHELGPLASPSDPVAIGKAIERLLDESRDTRSFEPPVAFERRRLAGRLAAMLDDVSRLGSPVLPILERTP